MSSLGRTISGGANVLRGYEAGVDRQRVARQNQLAIEEANRLAQMKSQMSQQAGTMFQPVPIAELGVPVTPGEQMPIAPVAPAAAAPGAAVDPQSAAAIEQRRLDTMRNNSRASAKAAAQQRSGKGAGTPQGMTQQERDRMELLRVPAAIGDVVQAPAAAGLNVFGAAAAGAQNVAGRVVNAITGEQTLPTDKSYQSYSLTPFYDRFVREPEQRDAAARGGKPTTSRTVETASSDRATAAPLDMARLNAAVEQVESGGRVDAVSPKGAVGPMQTMPTTLTDPGFGVRPAQNNSPEELRRVGQDYLAAMLRKYNGNLDHALAAYNWGPGNADKWIAAGADPSKLPKETREYIPKVKTAMGVTGEATVRTVTSMPTSQRDNIEMAESYLANPESIPFEMQQLNQLAQQQYQIMVQQRNETARLAQIMMQSGTSIGIQNAMQMREALNAQDLEIVQFQNQIAQKQMYLQGMQGMREFATANDPRRLSGVLSQFMGVPVSIQIRADGKYNYFVNGKRVQEGVSAAQIASTALREFSPEARQAASASAALENELALKQKYGDAVVNAMRDIQKAIIDGEYKLAGERAKKEGLDVKPDAASGKWAVVRDGQTLHIIDPAELTTEKTAQGTITLPPPARRITIPGMNFTGS